MVSLYAAITNPDFWHEIQQAITSKGEEILYKKIDKQVDIFDDMERIGRLPIRILIIDLSCIEDQKKIPQAIRRYRIKNDSARIIIIAPNCLPGNDTISILVTMGIYDIINPRGEKPEDMIILPSLLEHIDTPSTYSKAVKWDVGAHEAGDYSQSVPVPIKSKTQEKVIEKTKTVTIEKDKIVGTIVIAIAGTIHRIGTTHIVLSLAQFLKDHNVAVVELHKSTNFNAIKNAYDDVVEKKEMFSLDGIDYFPYSQSLNVLDILQEDYNYIILDMGTYKDCDMEEFKRANERIIVSGVKDWEITELELILRNDDRINKNKYLFNFASKTAFEFIKSNMDNLPCFLTPMNPDAFQKNRGCSDLFNAMLKDVLPKVKEKTRGSFLKSLLNHFPLRGKGGEDFEA